MAGGEVEGLPFRLRVGVTGHRRLDRGVDWAAWVAKGLAVIRAALSPAPGTPLAWSVVSSLAEGADRLVAEVILQEPGSRLEVPLPLPAEEYLADFASGASKASFKNLLGRADVIVSPPRFDSREAAYEWAGRTMVRRSDVVIALWDGKPARGIGGTASIVDFACRQGRAVVHIHTEGELGVEILAANPDEAPDSPAARRASEVASALHAARALGEAPALHDLRADSEVAED